MWYHSPAKGSSCEFFVHIVNKYEPFCRRILVRNNKYTFDFTTSSFIAMEHHNLIKIEELPTHVKKAMIKRELKGDDKVF